MSAAKRIEEDQNVPASGGVVSAAEMVMMDEVTFRVSAGDRADGYRIIKITYDKSTILSHKQMCALGHMIEKWAKINWKEVRSITARRRAAVAPKEDPHASR